MRSAVACLSNSLDNPTCVVHFFIYNPYSIVNEPYDAGIGAELNRSIALTADLGGVLSCAADTK
jgi:hypothetical protein